MKIPKMSRIQFQYIADTIKDCDTFMGINVEQQETIAPLFAARLSRTNRNFNKEKFLDACGYPDADKISFER